MTKEEIRTRLHTIKSMQDIPDFLIETGLNNNLCELGVFEGAGIKTLVKSNPKLLIGIDLWQDDNNWAVTDGMTQSKMDENYREALQLLELYPAVQYIKDYTTNCADKFEDEYFDFIYVDADHSYEGCEADLINWWPKVKRGGILSGHDYFEAASKYKFGVIQAVDEFRINNSISDVDFYVTPEEYAPSWFIIK